MAKKLPRAYLVGEGAKREKIWEVRWPSSASVWGKTYIAITYPETGLTRFNLLTAAKLQPVTPKVAAKITPQIRDAVERALNNREIPTLLNLKVQALIAEGSI